MLSHHITPFLLFMATLPPPLAHTIPSPHLLSIRAANFQTVDNPRAVIFFETSPKASVTKPVIIGTTVNPLILKTISAKILEVQDGKNGQGKVVHEASKNLSSSAAEKFEGDAEGGVGKGKKMGFGKDVKVMSRIFCDFV
jgi:hypothetical protein